MWRRNAGVIWKRTCSSFTRKDDILLEQDADRKFGWMLKLAFCGTAAYVGYQFFPYMGDNLMEQSIRLLDVKDPLFKRMEASRLFRFASNDERKARIVERGGVWRLLEMLEGAKDDKTRKEALKTLDALSSSSVALKALNQARALQIIRSTPTSLEDVSIYKSSILKKLEDLK